MLHKMLLVSFGAENEVSVQSSARFHELERHAIKEGTKFSKRHCWFQYGRLVWQENLVEIRHKYMAHSAKFAMWTVGNSGKFLKAEEKRMLLFSHLLYYSSAQHFSKLLGTKSFSFGRCDQELKSKPWKKAKKWKCSELLRNRLTGKSSVIRSQCRKRHSNPMPCEEVVAVWICPITFNFERKFLILCVGKILNFY